jgi:hypothetical protein
MKRGLEALDESKFFVDLGNDGAGQGVPPPPNTMLYLGEVTEGLEFIAADELKSRLRRDWAAMGGDSELKVDAAPLPEESHEWADTMVRYQEGSGLIFFRLPTCEASSAIRARTAFLGGLLTVETVFVFLDHVVGLPQDESGLDAIEHHVRDRLAAAKWDQALHVWARHFRELGRASTTTSASTEEAETVERAEAAADTDTTALSSSTSFAPQFRCSCRRRGEQMWQSHAVAGYARRTIIITALCALIGLTLGLGSGLARVRPAERSALGWWTDSPTGRSPSRPTSSRSTSTSSKRT